MIEMPDDPILTMRHHTIVEIISLYVTSKQLELSPDVIQLQNEPYLASLIGIESMHPHEVFTVTVTQLLTAIDAHLLPIAPPSARTTPHSSPSSGISPVEYARLELMADGFVNKLAAHLQPALSDPNSQSQSQSQSSQQQPNPSSTGSPRKKQRVERSTIESQQLTQSQQQVAMDGGEDDEIGNGEEDEPEEAIITNQ